MQASEWRSMSSRMAHLETRFDTHLQTSLDTFNDLKNLIIKLEQKIDHVSRGGVVVVGVEKWSWLF